MVKKYGQNPMAYLALEDDKKYFFGSDCEGVIAFAVAADVAVCCGDIITSDQQAPILLSEFMAFCRENNYSILLMNVTQRFLELYKTMGFGTIKYGEDACFLLSEYNLSGGRVAKVRAAINHANKAGITVEEYKPQQKRDFKLENKINEVSRNWLANKNCGELIFTLGSIGFDHPYEKRYFVAKDVNNKVLGFVVFIPYEGKQAYLADITRRVSNSPQGWPTLLQRYKILEA
ncbi:MAG: phosphatidylglycerol lysyltransferase domain-containing protein [Filifactoraceae bacterium]